MHGHGGQSEVTHATSGMRTKGHGARCGSAAAARLRTTNQPNGVVSADPRRRISTAADQSSPGPSTQNLELQLVAEGTLSSRKDKRLPLDVNVFAKQRAIYRVCPRCSFLFAAFSVV